MTMIGKEMTAEERNAHGKKALIKGASSWLPL